MPFSSALSLKEGLPMSELKRPFAPPMLREEASLVSDTQFLAFSEGSACTNPNGCERL